MGCPSWPDQIGVARRMIPHRWHLYSHFVLARIRTQTAYRTAFLLDVASNFLMTALDFSMVWLIFERFGDLVDWSMWQVRFLHRIISILFGLSNMVRVWSLSGWNQAWNLRLQVNSLLFYLLPDSGSVRPQAIGQGLILLMANAKLPVSWGSSKVIFLLAQWYLIFIGLMVVDTTLCFWTIQSIEFINIFTHGGKEAGNFPSRFIKTGFAASALLLFH